MVSEDSAVRGMCGKEICEILFEVSDLCFLYSPEGTDRVKEVVSIYNMGRKNGKTECHRLTGESAHFIPILQIRQNHELSVAPYPVFGA